MCFSYSEMMVGCLKMGYLLPLVGDLLWGNSEGEGPGGQTYFLSPLLSQIPRGP